MNLTDAFIAYLLDKGRGELPPAVILQAKRCILDYTGTAAAGSKALAGRLDRYMDSAAPGNIRIIGGERSFDAQTAAFLNAFHAHVLELDDGHRFGMIHLAAPIQSAVSAAAQAVHASGADYIKAVVLGYEAAARLSMAMQPAHKKRGFHTTGTCGTIGAAVGAGVIFHLDPVQMKTALSAAGTSAAGLLEIQEEASELKPYNAARAAMDGLNAAMLGKTALYAPDDIFGGARGMTRALAEGADPRKLLENTSYFEIERIYLKAYAACRHCHSAVDAVLQIREFARFDPAEITSIVVDTYPLAVKGHDHTEIRGVASAKLSIPFSVAAAYVLGHCGMSAFTPETIRRPDILALSAKTTVRVSETFANDPSGKRAASVTIRCADGREMTRQVDHAKGDPENPLSDRELIDKFKELMEFSGRADRSDALLAAVKNMESCFDDFIENL